MHTPSRGEASQFCQKPKHYPGRAELEEVNLLTVSYNEPMLVISAEHGKLPISRMCLPADLGLGNGERKVMAGC